MDGEAHPPPDTPLPVWKPRRVRTNSPAGLSFFARLRGSITVRRAAHAKRRAHAQQHGHTTKNRHLLRTRLVVFISRMRERRSRASSHDK
jgi:hypothetical protein